MLQAVGNPCLQDRSFHCLLNLKVKVRISTRSCVAALPYLFASRANSDYGRQVLVDREGRVVGTLRVRQHPQIPSVPAHRER